MKIRLERRGDYIDFFKDWLWFYEVKVFPALDPGLSHLRDKEWFSPGIEAELLDLTFR